ncbi:MAG TPA: pitrilysin family protein [Actinomycetota bacterium]|nr:pitrilysin family protein [Actinomycetota bacterium]
MPLRRTEFASGLRVVTERMPGVRSVALGFWVLAGSRDERPRISGASHFLEHLLFKGTRSRSARDIAEAFDAVGGDVNAFTAKEYTCFYARVLDRDLPLAVDHLCDMLQHSLLRPEDVESERRVILEEIHMHEDTPDELIHDVFNEELWPGHPLGRPILGTRASIEAATREQIRRFYRRHYLPGNVVVVGAGSVDHDRLLELLASSMAVGPIRTDGDPTGWNLRSAGRPPAPSGRTVVVRRRTEQAHIVLGTNGLGRLDPDRFAMGIVNGVVGGGMSSRLFQRIREERGLAYSVYSYHTMYTEAGIFAAYAGTTPARAPQVIDLIRAELDDVAGGGLTEEEFERARGHVKGSLVLSLEDPASRMSRLGKSEISHGEILTVSQILKRIESVTLDDARRAAKRVLSQPLTLTVIGPFGPRAFAGWDAR